MVPEQLFSLTSTLALAAWIILAISAFRNNSFWRDTVCGLLIPIGFSFVYTSLIIAFFAQAEGGFGKLADVQLLFRSDWVALAGWVHYLAFDLFVGSAIARRLAEQQLPKALLIALLPLTFLFGPIGLLAFSASGLMFDRNRSSL